MKCMRELEFKFYSPRCQFLKFVSNKLLCLSVCLSVCLSNQTTLSLELVVAAIGSHIVMLCVCKWTVSGGCVLNF